MTKIFRVLIWLTILVGLVVGIARLTAIRWWRVPTNDPWLEASVSPTLRGGDWIVLWRLTEPDFGDLVMCPEPGAPERVVLGRILGESNDEIRFTSGQVALNRRQIRTERNCLKPKFEVMHPDQNTPIEQSCSIEDLDGVLHPRGDVTGTPTKATSEETKVPAGEVFLVSDNRLFPYDSRDYGTVPRASCTEAVFFRLWGRNGFRDVENRFTYIR